MRDIRVERFEKNRARMTVTVFAETLQAGMEKAYEKNHSEYEVEGVKKGEASRQQIEAQYGPYTFLEAGINEMLPGLLERAIDASGLEVVSEPKIEIQPVEVKEGLIFTVEVYVMPEIQLGTYKGLQIPEDALTQNVTDGELEHALEMFCKNHAKKVVVERPVMLGDEVLLDFEGFVDGVAFPGGKGEAYPLVIGSGSFIPGFEEQVLTRRKDVPFDVNVVFPQNYPAAELQGKEAVFKCLIHEIREDELPELDDAFVAANTEYETVEAFRASVKDTLAHNKARQNETAKESILVQMVTEQSQIIDLPDCMVEKEIDTMMEEVEYEMSRGGMNPEDYYQAMNTTREAFREQIKPDAYMRVKARLVLDKIAEEEYLVVTDAEVNQEIQNMVVQYGLPDDSMFNDTARRMLRDDLRKKKTVKMIVDASR